MPRELDGQSYDMYEEYDATGSFGDELLTNNLNKIMNNGLLTLSWGNVRSALISALITAVLGIAGYIIGVGDIFKIDFHTLANVGALSGLTAIVSLIKNYLTTNQGNFLGTVDTKA